MLPSGIYVDEDGRVYFVDQWYRKVDIYRPARIQENEGYLAAGVAAPASAAATSAPAAATPAVAPVPPGAATAVPAK
jgi:hypothetical protein